MANEFNIKNGFISNSNSIVLGAFTATTISATTYYNLPTTSSTDTFVTGGTYNSGTGIATFTNNTGGTFTVSGFSTSNSSTTFTGGTVSGATNFTGGLSSNTISATTYYNLPTDIFITGGTYDNVSGVTTFIDNTGGTFTVSGYYTGYTTPIDVYVTGGTYSNGSLSFVNNTGGTFDVIGTTPSLQEVYTASTVPNFIINSTQGPVIFRNDTGDDNNALFTVNNNAGLLVGEWDGDGSLFATSLSANTYYNLPIDVRVTGGTYSSGTAIFTNNTGGTFSVSGFSSGGVFTGGTVNGETTFTNGLIGNTVSATTYFNLPTDINVTGGTYSNGTTTFTNNTGGTFTVSGFKTDDIFVTGGTYSNGTTIFTNNTGGTFNVTTTTSYAAGVISGATGWTSTGTGQINLPAVKVALYNNAFNIEPIMVYDVATGTSGTGGIPSLTDNDTNYVVIEYNNGTPIYNVYDNDSMVNDSSVVLFMIVYRLGNFIHTLEFGNQGAGLANKLNDRFIMTDRFGYESGLSLGLSASTEVITLSAGVAWNGPNRQSLNSLNSQDDIFFKNYHSGGNWTYTTTGNTINNTHYDNGTDIVLATGGKYLVNWYFRGQEINDHLYEVYSTSEYDSIALAQLSTEPSLPELITSHAILLGRIIIGVGASTGLTESAFVNVFQSTNVTSHNDLTALQGGSAGQYYHLNSNQYNNLALTNTNNNFSVSQSFNNGLSATTITADTSIITAVSATTITTDNFIGDGSQITNIPIPYGLISAISSGNYLI